VLDDGDIHCGTDTYLLMWDQFAIMTVAHNCTKYLIDRVEIEDVTDRTVCTRYVKD
jgi:hypothetical protein